MITAIEESLSEFLTAADHQIIISSIQKYVDVLFHMFELDGFTDQAHP